MAGPSSQNRTQAAGALADGRSSLIWRRRIADTETPVSAALKLIEPERGDFLLESVEVLAGKHLHPRPRGIRIGRGREGYPKVFALGSAHLAHRLDPAGDLRLLRQRVLVLVLDLAR